MRSTFGNSIFYQIIKMFSGISLNCFLIPFHWGHPWPYQYSSCTTNIYKLDAYAGARGFVPELRQDASRMPSPCGLTVVYKNSPPWKLGKSRYRLYWVESTIKQQFKKKMIPFHWVLRETIVDRCVDIIMSSILINCSI